MSLFMRPEKKRQQRRGRKKKDHSKKKITSDCEQNTSPSHVIKPSWLKTREIRGESIYLDFCSIFSVKEKKKVWREEVELLRDQSTTTRNPKNTKTIVIFNINISKESENPIFHCCSIMSVCGKRFWCFFAVFWFLVVFFSQMYLPLLL